MSEEQKETEAQKVKRRLAKRELINKGLDEYFNSFQGRFIVASALNIGINIIKTKITNNKTLEDNPTKLSKESNSQLIRSGSAGSE